MKLLKVNAIMKETIYINYKSLGSAPCWKYRDHANLIRK